MIERPLPKFARDLLSCCPSAGGGVHNWLFRAAKVLHAFYPNKDEMFRLLASASEGCGRHIPDEEIWDAIQNSESYAWKPTGQRRGVLVGKRRLLHTAGTIQIKKLGFNPFVLARVAAKLGGVDAEWMAAHSPVHPENQTPSSFLHALYEPGENIVVFDVFKSQGQHLWTCLETSSSTCELESFTTGKPNGAWYLTNPVDGSYKPNGRKKRDGTGMLSRRSEPNVTSWRYLVLESDHANPAHWLAALAQMPLRIAAIYSSGGKSIHALVRVDAASKQHWDELRDAMKPGLVTLGADPAALSAVRLSRLPGCQRPGSSDKDGVYRLYPEPRMQTLLYLNPNPTRTPIRELPARNDTEVPPARPGEAFR
jgi:hypothetical protein